MIEELNAAPLEVQQLYRIRELEQKLEFDRNSVVELAAFLALQEYFLRDKDERIAQLSALLDRMPHICNQIGTLDPCAACGYEKLKAKWMEEPIRKTTD